MPSPAAGKTPTPAQTPKTPTKLQRKPGQTPSKVGQSAGKATPSTPGRRNLTMSQTNALFKKFGHNPAAMSISERVSLAEKLQAAIAQALDNNQNEESDNLSVTTTPSTKATKYLSLYCKSNYSDLMTFSEL